MNYSEAREFLASLQQAKGMIFDLEPVKKAYDSIGYDIKTIQVAGTNGKGSVATMIANILTESGYRVGLYTSPSIVDPLDIIKVDGREISKEDYARLVTAYSDKGLTAFEIETCVAWSYFKELLCDVCVTECGLGGKSDATNVVMTTVMSIITSIGYDHMAILGDTLEKIAREKAGIIKPGTYVYSTSTNRAVDTVIESVAKDNSAVCRMVKSDSSDYAKKNIDLVIASAEGLKKLFGKVDDDAVTRGIRNTYMPCRYDMISTDPVVILDGAHNRPAIDALCKRLKADSYKDISFVIGVFADKDYDYIIDTTLPLAYEYICVDAVGARNLGGEKLLRVIKDKGFERVSYISSYEELCDKMKNEKRTYVVTGSLSYLGQIKKIYAGG